MSRRLLALLFLILVLVSCDSEQPPIVTANEMFNRAVSLFDEQSYQQAEAFFTQSITLYQQQGEFSKMGDAHGYLARISLVHGQLKDALEEAQVGLEQSRQANDFRGQARLRLLLGDVYRMMGDYERALEEYRSSHSLSSAFGDKQSQATAEMKKGSALYWMDRWDEAHGEYGTALSYFRGSGNTDQAAAALVGIGEVYARQNRFGEALSSLTQARQSLDASEYPLLDARLQVNLGNIYRAINDANSALREFRDGANRLRARRVGKEYETLLLFFIGIIYSESGRIEDAKNFFNEAVSVARSSGDRLAENYLYLFLARATERQIPASQRNFEFEKRINSFNQIAQRFRDCHHKTGEAYAAVQAGDLYRSVGRLAEAQEMYQRAVDLEHDRLGEYVDQDLHLPYQVELGIEGEREEWYLRLADVLVQLRRPEDALVVMDRARTRTYFKYMADADIAIRNVGLRADMDNLRGKLREIKLLQVELSSLLAGRRNQISPQQINQLRVRSAKALDEMHKTAGRVASAYPNYLPFTGLGSLQLPNLQSLIPRSTLVLSFLPAEDRLYLFALSRTGFEVKTVPVGRDRILALTGEYMTLMRDPNVYAGAAGEASLPAMTRFAALSTQLYDLLIRPIDALIDRNIILIPGDFENFPFHALERQERNGNVRYLVEITSVDYLSNLSSLRFRTTSAGRMRTITAMGNPTGRNWSIDYELRDIRSFFKDANVLLGFEATWESLNSSRADVLQLATDFKNNPGNTPFGTIAVSDGRTLEESVDVPFENLTQVQAFPVVVLSNTYGQGLGLTPIHAFVLRMNGTSDVFLNAWGAERKAAKFFSEFFYTHLANGLAPGDAYRQALLNLMRIREVSHPYSWGQFFHFGVG